MEKGNIIIQKKKFGKKDCGNMEKELKSINKKIVMIIMIIIEEKLLLKKK